MNTARLASTFGGVALIVMLAHADVPERVHLLNVNKGQLPNDTGSDATKLSIENHADLGKAVKVEFRPGDSFGDRVARVKNWKPFVSLQFDAFNPSQETIGFVFSVKHRRTTSFQTRADVPFKLKPGKNHIRIGIDEMVNVNGSAPDLADIVRWYISVEEKKAPTVFFGDLWFESENSVVAPAVGAPAGNVAYRVQGTVGALKVDLTITPISLGKPTPAAPAAQVHGDPARLKRIRAAKMPKIDRPIAFDTPEADAIVAALEIFPPDNPWNLVVADWPVHANSKNIIGEIGTTKPFRCNPDMAFVLVPSDQKRVDVKIVSYPGESDKGPFPIPDNIPIEGWPANYQRSGKKVSLDDVQRDRLKEGGDRHASVLDPVNRILYEFYTLRKTDAGWEAAQTSIFDLKSNKQRPDGWTSTDAAGLPLYPSIVRYDELKRGEIEHALRVTVPRSRKDYVYPATHHAGHGTDVNLPRMGERLRLRQNFDTADFSPEAQTILKALKKYGMFVADNGIAWAISVAPDPRIPPLHADLRKLQGSDFEVITPPPGYKPPAEAGQ